MNHNTPSYLCALALSFLRLSAARLRKLLAHFPSLQSLFAASDAALLAQGLSAEQIHALRRPQNRYLEKALSFASKPNHHILTLEDPDYPPLLREIADPPLLLYVLGEKSSLTTLQLGIVGSRNPSYTGREIAHEFAYLLTQAGITITSGLATGIDTAAHEGALAADGPTIAVLGNGLEHIYPKQNKQLAAKIQEKGCLISEYPLDTPPHAAHFPQRNRIITGLSRGTLVVEAALKSGSLISARLALEQNRDVFAIPGSIRSGQSSGTLKLIQQGALCVTSPEDILEEWHIHPHVVSNLLNRRTDQVLDPISEQVIGCIENEGATIDQICVRSKLSAHLVAATVLALEIEGEIKQHQGVYVRSL